jgi:PPOX class probable F420-dependent enzyme
VPLAEEAVARALDGWPVGRLALLDEEGGPRQLPVVFARAGGALWSPVDGKPKRGPELARLRRLAAEPRVSLLLDHYADDWTALWWIEVLGRAEVVRSPAPDADPRLAPAVAALRRKYPQYAATPLFRGPPTLIRIAIERVRSWSAGAGGP